MCAGLKKYWCEWCRLWPLLHTCGIVLGGTKICHHSHPKALDVMNRGFSALCTFSTSHNRLYHQIEKRKPHACLYTTPLSTAHSLAGWRRIGKVVFPFAAPRWKIRRQNKTSYIVTNAENFPEHRINADRGETRRWEGEREREIECREMENRETSG